MIEQPILQVRKLCKHFPIYKKGFFNRQTGVVKAADEISFATGFGHFGNLVVLGLNGSPPSLEYVLLPEYARVFSRPAGQSPLTRNRENSGKRESG